MHTSFITLPLARRAVQAELNSNCAPRRGLPTVLIVSACLRQYTPDGVVHSLQNMRQMAQRRELMFRITYFNATQYMYILICIYIHVQHNKMLDFLDFQLLCCKPISSCWSENIVNVESSIPVHRLHTVYFNCILCKECSTVLYNAVRN